MSNMLQGIVYLTPEQYETLVNEGVITVNGKTIAYNKNTLYITKNNNPSTSVEGFYDPNTGIVYAKGLELNGVDINTIIDNKIAESGSGVDLSGIQTQIDEINSKKKYRHDIKSPTSYSSWECYITLITEDATPFNISTLKAYLYENYPVGVPAWSSELHKDETEEYIQYQYVYKMYGTETHLMYSSHRIRFDKVLLDGTQILCTNPSIDRGSSANVGFQITDTVTEL